MNLKGTNLFADEDNSQVEFPLHEAVKESNARGLISQPEVHNAREA